MVWSYPRYQASQWILTFLIYIMFHATRKTYSIVKPVLQHVNNGTEAISTTNMTTTTPIGWSPFNTDNGGILLGSLDTIFLCFYAGGLVVAGHLGDRLNIRYFLSCGMFFTAFFLTAFGLAYPLNIHSMVYFVIVQACAGLCQAVGWPCVVAVMGKWFGKGTRGTVMGIWNSHTNIGNILGSIISTASLTTGMNGSNWPMALIIPAIMMAVFAVITFFALIPDPHSVGFRTAAELDQPEEVELMSVGASLERPLDEDDIEPSVTTTTRVQVLSSEDVDVNLVVAPVEKPISLWEALMIPGLLAYAFCLFFSKLVNYTFLFWLPFYLDAVGYRDAGYLSTLFDVGGIVGGILAGFLSDRLRTRSIIAFTFLLASIPSLLIYRSVTSGGADAGTNIFFMLILGMFVNGPYALITTAVTADLGSRVRGASALSTVTGVIDGVGSLGAAVQGVTIGYVSSHYQWDAVFNMLIICCTLAAILLIRLVYVDTIDLWHRCCHTRQHTRPHANSTEQRRASSPNHAEYQHLERTDSARQPSSGAIVEEEL